MTHSRPSELESGATSTPERVQAELDRQLFHLKTLYDVSRELLGLIEVKAILKNFLFMTTGNFGVVHGFGAAHGLERRLRQEFEGVDLIVFGHSHQPFLAPVDEVLMFNPGSPTDRRWAPSRALGLIHLDQAIQCEQIPLD